MLKLISKIILMIIDFEKLFLSLLTSSVQSCRLSSPVDNFALHSGSLDKTGRIESDYSAAPPDCYLVQHRSSSSIRNSQLLQIVV